MFSFDKRFEIKNFEFEINIPVPDTTNSFTVKYGIIGIQLDN